MRWWRFRKPGSERTADAAGYITAAHRQFRHFHQYADVVAQLPFLLRQHGLGQTLSYFKLRSGGRTESPYGFVYQQLQEHLEHVSALREKDLLQALTRMDSERYLRLCMETYTFSEAWRRAVRADSRRAPTAANVPSEEVDSL